jgi:thiamine kinase-like enzyme
MEAFVQTARSFDASLPGEPKAFLEPLRAVELDQQNDPSDWRRMCHNDLVSVNYLYLDKVDSIVVLDWEFAGLGDIYDDLAAVLYTHDRDGPIPAVEGFDYHEFAEYLFAHDLQGLRAQFLQDRGQIQGSR